ncbi:NUMOD4 motif-containing HNH endonuclease [Rhodococcus ruber]|uniref:NUMOD4 motif-containing HNH endonuclease n=1 Tax=Rhodococcus ruber TaxID=1830 RepID=UPI0039E7F48F
MQLTLDFTTEENWAPVPDFEGYYEVSDLGRIRSVDRVIVRKNGSRQTVRSRILALHPNVVSGYPQVHLYISGHGTMLYAHQLVAAAFIGPRPDGMYVCHKDGNPQNNAASNLRYDTPSSNMYDRVHHGRHFAANKTHCKNGHEFTRENTRHVTERTGHLRRRCLECVRIKSRRDRLRAKLQKEQQMNEGTSIA